MSEPEKLDFSLDHIGNVNLSAPSPRTGWFDSPDAVLVTGGSEENRRRFMMDFASRIWDGRPMLPGKDGMASPLPSLRESPTLWLTGTHDWENIRNLVRSYNLPGRAIITPVTDANIIQANKFPVTLTPLDDLIYADRVAKFSKDAGVQLVVIESAPYFTKKNLAVTSSEFNRAIERFSCRTKAAILISCEEGGLFYNILDNAFYHKIHLLPIKENGTTRVEATRMYRGMTEWVTSYYELPTGNVHVPTPEPKPEPEPEPLPMQFFNTPEFLSTTTLLSEAAESNAESE